jgi:hypothetical protein
MRRRMTDGDINEMAAKSRFMRALDEADAHRLLAKRMKRRRPGDDGVASAAPNPLAPAGGATADTDWEHMQSLNLGSDK